MNKDLYPRPQFIRDNYQLLDGIWQFSFDDNMQGIKEKWFNNFPKDSKQILVPFVFESEKSGIHDLAFHDHVWYQKSLLIPKDWNQQVILNFEAVDYITRVYINGQFVGENVGGYNRFSFDITPYLNYKLENLVVYVSDPSTEERIPRGKQSWVPKHHSIWYPRNTGIWQSVWMEPIHQESIKRLKINSDIDEGSITLELETSTQNKKTLELIIKDGDEVIVSDKYLVSDELKRNIQIWNHKVFYTNQHHHGKTWSPENPHLYNIEFNLYMDNVLTDHVKSYFGMRKIHTENGMVYLNNRPYYLKLVLDQGYFKDGLLTASSDEALKQDIELAKQMGFNGARKHQKVESERYFYHADKLGFIVWSELPATASFDQKFVPEIINQWTKMIERDINHPSIIAWVPINESWGVPNINHDYIQQNYALTLYHLTKTLDPTRLVISNDGWELVTTDIAAIHNYSHGKLHDKTQHEIFNASLKTKEAILNHYPANRNIFANGFEYDGEPIMLTEFGGISFTNTHENGWGYSHVDNPDVFLEEYERILKAIQNSEAIVGFCYTQLTDVEQEINGLLNYDRSEKVSLEKIKLINDQVSFMISKNKK
ncbi:glycoside hydrolase family 2 protein [Acholeplasma granularum]|uniref:glycoside hydrolase family 2 protein n=1 Tax=Acholeplasma granularum TaxID=264635 RepID=UPI000471C49D|nr:glycoside hydrolase family 2 [Acholeplasma granularum]